MKHPESGEETRRASGVVYLGDYVSFYGAGNNAAFVTAFIKAMLTMVKACEVFGLATTYSRFRTKSRRLRGHTTH